MVVVDANTSSYVEDPSEIDADTVTKDEKRIEVFFDALFTGQVPEDFDLRAVEAAEAAARAAAASELAANQHELNQKPHDTSPNQYDDTDGLDLFSMADDGTGRDIEVSSVFISAMQGARIIRAMAFMQRCNALESDPKLSLTAEIVMRSSRPGSQGESQGEASSNLEGVSGGRLTFPLSALSQIGIVPKNVILQIQRGLQASNLGESEDHVKMDVKANL